MLRIPLPEDDGFALTKHVKRPRDRRTKGLELQSFWRVLDVVEVLVVLDFLRLQFSGSPTAQPPNSSFIIHKS